MRLPLLSRWCCRTPMKISLPCPGNVTKYGCFQAGYNALPQIALCRFLSLTVPSASTSQRWRVMFFGTDNFSLPHLKVLNNGWRNNHLIDKLEVVVPESKFMKRRGRRRILSPVWEYCQEQDLTYHHWPLRDKVHGFDVGVIVSFGHLIPSWLIECFPLGIINVHPSLLPRWRGASPIQHTILNGDEVTGVSIMRIKPNRFDIGPVLLQRECATPPRSTTESLSEMLADMGCQMLFEVFSDLPGIIEKEQPQTDHGFTKGYKVTTDMAWINWEKSSSHIDRLYRAVSGQMSLKTMFDGQEVKLEQMVPPSESTDHPPTNDPPPPPGSVIFVKSKNVLIIRCKDGWVGFKHISPVGRKRLTAQEFYNGYLSSSGPESPHERNRFENQVSGR